MRNSTNTLCMLLSLASNLGYAQFFPTEQAAWCLTRNIQGGGEDQYTLALAPEQDTVIQGISYMVIEYTSIGTPTMELWPFSRCYVRNDQEGRGYVRVDDVDMDLFVGDVNVQVGDIVPDVAMGDSYCENFWEYGTIADMIVDSIVMIEENGLQARRLYVQPLCFPIASPGRSFWQTGLGTPFGPFLMLNQLSGATPECAAVDDTTRFRLFEELQLGGPLCYCYDLGLGVSAPYREKPLAPSPNPSPGLFQLDTLAAAPIIVMDVQGREVVRVPAPGREIDLTNHPTGMYMAVMDTPAGRVSQRLIVMR